VRRQGPPRDNGGTGDEVSADDIINTFKDLDPPGGRATFEEQLCEHIHRIRDFCDGLEYQIQFGDQRMLMTLERDGASFLWLAVNCLSCERWLNSKRGANQPTWESGTLNAMFYQTHPNPADATT
jgi:hypothetical protein